MNEPLANTNPIELTNLTAIVTDKIHGAIELDVAFVLGEHNVPSSKLDQFDFSRYLFEAEELALTGAISFFDEKIELPDGEVIEFYRALFDSAGTPKPFDVILDDDLGAGSDSDVSFRDCIILDESKSGDSLQEGPFYDFAAREIE
jgi:hypothetical protein